MVTFNITDKTLKQLKKFISGWDVANELLYLYTDERNNLYLVLFDNNHIYISYLKLGVTDEFTGTYELNQSYIEGENDPKALKKFISKQKELKLDSSNDNLIWIGNDFKDFYSSKYGCDLNLDLISFCNRSNKELYLKKQDLKVLELYKNDLSCIYFKEGRIEFKFYGDDYNVFAKHIICDNYNNQLETHCHISNRYLLQTLRKFNSKDKIIIRLDEREPLIIESEDYTGIIAPRIIFEEAYGSTDGIFDTLQ